ncbi:MAG: zinc ribbon domain-containing protein [Halobacteriota archaeon]
MTKQDDHSTEVDRTDAVDDADGQADPEDGVELPDETDPTGEVEAEDADSEDAPGTVETRASENVEQVAASGEDASSEDVRAEPAMDDVGTATATVGSPEKGADEVYCSSCGEVIKADAEICPNCGVRQHGGSGDEVKNSALSFVASLIVPGAGQVYNGQLGRGIAAFLGVGVADTIIVLLAVVLTLVLIGPLLFFLIPVVHVLIAYDAYDQAEKINRGEVTV